MICTGRKDLHAETVDRIWLPPRDSNPDMLIQSYNRIST
jgi:hypothetical protein